MELLQALNTLKYPLVTNVLWKNAMDFSIVSLFSCKLGDKDESFGLQNKELLAEIEDLSSRFSDMWDGW